MQPNDCTCVEHRDDETGEVNDHYCQECAATDGHCTCNCDCDACSHTETPCGYKPETPCFLCVIRMQRKDCEDGVAQVTEAIKNLCAKHIGVLTTKSKNTLAHWIEPCADALAKIDRMSPWGLAVLAEIKNILALEGHTEKRLDCGMDACRCHLRTLNSLLMKGSIEQFRARSLELEARIVKAEDAMHAARDITVKAMNEIDVARLRKQIADEMLEEFHWHEGEGEEFQHQSDANNQRANLTHAVAREAAILEIAKESYSAALAAAKLIEEDYLQLMEIKKLVV